MSLLGAWDDGDAPATCFCAEVEPAVPSNGRTDPPSRTIANSIQAASRAGAPIDRNSLATNLSAGGPEVARCALDTCMQIMKDQSELSQAKIKMIRILDILLSAAQDSFLASQVVTKMKFFSKLAKMTLEDASKRKPSSAFFPAHATPLEVSQFLAAVCEFLDKWGRHFDGEAPQSTLGSFAKVRRQLQRDGVVLPAPEAYQFLEVPIQVSVPRASGSASAPGAPTEATLDAATIDRLVEEARQAHEEHGPSDIQTVNAHSRCESELHLWRHAAEEAADRGDFQDFERLSSVSHRASQALRALEAGAAAAAGGEAIGTMGPAPEGRAAALPVLATTSCFDWTTGQDVSALQFPTGVAPGGGVPSDSPSAPRRGKRSRQHKGRRASADAAGEGEGIAGASLNPGNIGDSGQDFPAQGISGGLDPWSPAFDAVAGAGLGPSGQTQMPHDMQSGQLDVGYGMGTGGFVFNTAGGGGGHLNPFAGWEQHQQQQQQEGSEGSTGNHELPSTSPPSFSFSSTNAAKCQSWGAGGGPGQHMGPFSGGGLGSGMPPVDTPWPITPPTTEPPPQPTTSEPADVSLCAPAAPRPSFPPSSPRPSDVGRCETLEARVQILQANNHTMQTQLTKTQEALGSALKSLRQLKPAQRDLVDARASLATLRDTNVQMQRDLDKSNSQLSEARQRQRAAEEELAEKGEQLSETRQRLFDEKRRSTQLEDQIQSFAELHASLQSQLQDERVRHAGVERDLRCMQHIVQTTATCLQRGDPRPEPFSTTPKRGSVPYSAGAGALVECEGVVPRRGVSLKVNQSDELASSVSGAGRATAGIGSSAAARSGSDSPVGEAPLQRLARKKREDSGVTGRERPADALVATKPARDGVNTNPFCVTAAPAPSLPQSAPEVWAKTARVEAPPCALLSRIPPASHECVERTCAHFRKLMVYPRGALYQDDHISMDMSVSASSTGRPSCAFDLRISNWSGRHVQQVRLAAGDLNGRSKAFDIHIEPSYGKCSTGVPLLPQQSISFRGLMEVAAPFEDCPQAELSYLLPDNLCCRALLRLPLTVARFMVPSELTPARFMELWSSPQFAQAEVTFVCAVRRTFLEAGGLFLYLRCLELGGILRPLSGLDESARSVVLVSLYPQRGKTSAEVLVRAELGDPHGDEGACRLTVRSAAYLVNRGLAHVLLDALCDPGALPAAAA